MLGFFKSEIWLGLEWLGRFEILNFFTVYNWILWIQSMTVCQKLGMIWENKVFQKLNYQKRVFTKNVPLNYNSYLIFFWKILDVENFGLNKVRVWHFLTNCHSLYSQNIYNDFLGVYWSRPKILLFRTPLLRNSTT